MTAAQPGQRRRIIAGHILRRLIGGKTRCDEFGQEAAGDGTAYGDLDAIEEIPPRNRDIDAQ